MILLSAHPGSAMTALFPGRRERSPGRPFRVLCLLAAVALMSLADLYMTLLHVRGIGFAEANPLARWIMHYDCPWLLGAWKVAFLSLTVVILATLRRQRSAEIACWVSLGVMIWLMGQWTQYAEKTPHLTPVIHQLSAADVPHFVRMSD